MTSIGVLVGSPHGDFRRRCCQALRADWRVRVLSETDSLRQLRVLTSTWSPSQIVLDLDWALVAPELFRDLPEDAPGVHLIVAADSLQDDGVLAAVELGARACIERDVDEETWRKAVRAVAAGEAWIPRWLLMEALADLQELLPAGLSAAMHLERLTERQREIVEWVAQGLSNKEIGQRLNISPTTVKTHLQNIFERIGVSGRQRLLVANFGARPPD